MGHTSLMRYLTVRVIKWFDIEYRYLFETKWKGEGLAVSVSFGKMSSDGTDVQAASPSETEPVKMELEPERIPRRKEPINLLTGIFYKCVYFLESELTKCVILAFVKNRGNSLGILFKGRKGAVFFSHDTFNEFASHINEITVALEKPEMYLLKGENFHIKVLRVFGKHHVFLYDGEHTLSLNS